MPDISAPLEILSDDLRPAAQARSTAPLELMPADEPPAEPPVEPPNEPLNEKDYIFLNVPEADRDRVIGQPIDPQRDDRAFRFDIVLRGRYQTPPDLD